MVAAVDVETGIEEATRDDQDYEIDWCMLPGSDAEKAAMKKELKNLMDYEAFERISPDDLFKLGLRASDVIPGKWVIQDRGGDDVRARIVATEVRHGAKDPDLYAPTPGLPSMSVVLPHASYFQQVSEEPWAVVTGDVSAAFLNAPVDGTVVVRPPRSARTWAE